MLIAGSIEAVDHKAARVRVKSGDWVSAWLPWSTVAAGRVRHWRPPSIGEQVMILSPSGQPENGMVLPGFYSDKHGQANDDSGDVTAMDWPDGARQHYDHAAHEWKLAVPAGGRIVLAIGGTEMILTADGITFVAPRIDLN
jgi:phage baseplate assembly protein V